MYKAHEISQEKKYKHKSLLSQAKEKKKILSQIQENHFVGKIHLTKILLVNKI